MDRARFLIESFGRKLGYSFTVLTLIVLLIVLIVSGSEVARAQVKAGSREKMVRQAAQDWIEVGMEQYRRGFYEQAEQSFLGAREYEEYLIADERERLNGLLEKTHTVLLERKRILEHIKTADGLVARRELAKAKAYLEKVKNSESLTEEGREQIAKSIRKIDNRLNEQKRQIAELYERSMEFYCIGEFEKAREGFARIDSILAQMAKLSVSTKAQAVEELAEATVEAVEDETVDVEAGAVEKAEPEVPLIQSGAANSVLVAVAEPELGEPNVAKPKVTEPVTDDRGSIEVTTNRKRNVLRSYIRAVVSDALSRAQIYVSRGQFDKAKKAIETAEQTVKENRLLLGDDLFRRYSSELKQVAEKIVQGKSEIAR